MTSNNPVVPPEYCLFQPETDHYGSRLALVFGNEGLHGKCPFYENGCVFCDIGSGEGIQFTTQMNLERLDFFREYYKHILNNISHFVLYNSGSMLNHEEMSQTTLSGILHFIGTLSSCKTVSLETREDFIRRDSLDALLKDMSPEINVRIILGLESQDDHIREDILRKGISKVDFERAVEIIAEFRDRIGIDINILLCPPPLERTEAITDALRTIDYGISLRNKFDLSANFNLHPYYNTTKGKSRLEEHRELTAVEIEQIYLVLKDRISSNGVESRIFIGCNKEIKPEIPIELA